MPVTSGPTYRVACALYECILLAMEGRPEWVKVSAAGLNTTELQVNVLQLIHAAELPDAGRPIEPRHYVQLEAALNELECIRVAPFAEWPFDGRMHPLPVVVMHDAHQLAARLESLPANARSLMTANITVPSDMYFVAMREATDAKRPIMKQADTFPRSAVYPIAECYVPFDPNDADDYDGDDDLEDEEDEDYEKDHDDDDAEAPTKQLKYCGHTFSFEGLSLRDMMLNLAALYELDDDAEAPTT